MLTVNREDLRLFRIKDLLRQVQAEIDQLGHTETQSYHLEEAITWCERLLEALRDAQAD